MTQSTGKQRLGPTQIRLGVPTKWALFDLNGNLLLREGAVIETEQQIDSLMRAGAYYYTGPNLTEYRPLKPEVVPVSSYQVVNSLIQRLEYAYEMGAEARQKSAFSDALFGLVAEIQAVCAGNPGAALGTAQLMIHAPSTLVHAVQCALACEVAAAKLAWSPEERVPVVAAALTQNIGLRKLQRVLDKQEARLSDEQRQEVMRHPRRSVEILHQFGVEDRLWLKTVLQHHERLDGSGYPRGLSGDQIIREARLIAIVDSYVAMTRPRVYRQTLRSRDAMREIFKQRGQAIDGDLSDVFLKAMGLFAPGSLIRHLSGEVAVTYAIAPSSEKLIVLPITDAHSRLPDKPDTPQEIDIAEVSGVLNLMDYERLIAHLGQIWPDLNPPEEAQS